MKKLYKIRLIISSIIFTLTIIAFWGLYPLHILNFQIGPMVQKVIFDFTVFTVIGLAFLILLTFLFGRFYCSILCPFGILQEAMGLVYDKIRGAKLPKLDYIKPKPYKYFIMALSFGFLTAGTALFIKYIDPYSIFGSLVTFSLYGIIFALLICALVFFKNRFFCTSICPIGTFLGLISKFSLLKMHMNENCISCGLCSRYCPSKCIDRINKKIDNENCVKCLKCVSLCPKNAMKYGLKIKEQKFDFTRRKAIISSGALAVFAGAYALGVKFSSDLYSKVKNIILPPGALNSKRMLNKCLNCNLCVNNCPTRILAKADSDCKSVHIDYSKGEHYCKYDCNKCSEICPAGAIKKTVLEEKQQIRIALAYVNKNCIECGKCISKCPKRAISYIDGSAIIDSSRCIGCGVCKAVCSMGAIDIYPINNQTEI